MIIKPTLKKEFLHGEDQDLVYKPVQCCICYNWTFQELLEAGVTSLEEIQEKFGCGKNCGTCLPYLKKMLKTGESSFEVIPFA